GYPVCTHGRTSGRRRLSSSRSTSILRRFEVESRLLAIAEAAGCAPKFTIAPPLTIRLELHERLTDRLTAARSGDKHGMAERLVQTIKRLRAAGVCHRDVKVTDVVVDRGQPLLIDFELGTEVDPGGPCYDLVGPGGSGIPIPPVDHAIGFPMVLRRRNAAIN